MKITLGQPLGFHNIGHRSSQQDALYPLLENLSRDNSLFIVCDGMGGHEGGEIASNTVVKGMHTYFETFMQPKPTRDGFMKLLERTQKDLDLHYDAQQGNRQMGTTLTFLCFHAGGYLAAHVGDSRIYHLRPSNITSFVYRSKDHSETAEMVEKGILKPVEALSYIGRNVLNRALMPGNRYEPTLFESDDVQAGDIFFLCSDGVTENLTDEMMRFIFAPYRSPEEMLALLNRHCALSHDNNTCLLIPVESVNMDEEVPTDDGLHGGVTTDAKFAVSSPCCTDYGAPEELQMPCHSIQTRLMLKPDTPKDDLLTQSVQNFSPDTPLRSLMEEAAKQPPHRDGAATQLKTGIFWNGKEAW